MRVLKIFFSALGLLCLVGVIAVLVGREVLLSTAVHQLRSVLRGIHQAQVDPAFVRTCLEYGGQPPNSENLIRLQLRFTSSTQYFVEIVCQNTESLRQTIQTGTLPPLVTKGLGESGIIDGQTQHGVTLNVLGRTGVVFLDEDTVRGSVRFDQQTDITLEEGPATVCTGYGFSCCSETSQTGQGTQQPAALDCPRSCYSTCAEKPVVVAFQADPNLMPENRVLSVRSGETAEFFYTISDISDTGIASQLAPADGSSFVSWGTLLLNALFDRHRPQDQLQTITLTFGDGQSTAVSDLQGVVEHTYTCTRALCVYNATIQAVTQSGIASTLTPNSRLQVQVSP